MPWWALLLAGAAGVLAGYIAHAEVQRHYGTQSWQYACNAMVWTIGSSSFPNSILLFFLYIVVAEVHYCLPAKPAVFHSLTVNVQIFLSLRSNVPLT